MKLCEHSDSGYALKVKFFLNWFKVTHEYEAVDIFSMCESRFTEFLNASKFAQVFVLNIDTSKKLDGYSNLYDRLRFDCT